MIDPIETLKRKGYNPFDLGRGSHKKVVRICDLCQKIDEIVFFDVNSHGMCASCSAKGRHERFKPPQTGKSHCIETKIKISCTRRNIEIDDFSGFISTERESLMRTDGYKLWRLSVFERDLFTCQECGKHGGDLHVHHIFPYRDYNDPDFVLSIFNGITLCEDCHRETYGNEYNFIIKYIMRNVHAGT